MATLYPLAKLRRVLVVVIREGSVGRTYIVIELRIRCYLNGLATCIRNENFVLPKKRKSINENFSVNAVYSPR